MGKGDGEVLDRALDAAEARMSEESESEATSEPVTSDPVEDAAVKEAVESTEKEPIDKPAKKGRDSSGKFSKAEEPEAQISDDQTANAESSSETITTPVESPSVEPPAFWSAEHKALFAKAPKEVQQAVSQYETQRNEWASRIQRDSERGKHIEARANEVFKPYELKLKANGIKDPFEAADRLLAWNELFEANPKAAIADLMAKNGLTLEDFVDGAQQQPEDPRIAQIQKDAEEARRSAEELKSQMEQEREEAFRYQIQEFKNGTDSHGNVRKAFAEMYAPQIDQAFQAIQKIQPMPLESALHQAYEYVLGEARKQFGANTKTVAAKTPEAIVAQAKKQQAASGSVTGAPKSGAVSTKARAKTIDDALDRAEAKMSTR